LDASSYASNEINEIILSERNINRKKSASNIQNSNKKRDSSSKNNKRANFRESKREHNRDKSVGATNTRSSNHKMNSSNSPIKYVKSNRQINNLLDTPDKQNSSVKSISPLAFKKNIDRRHIEQQFKCLDNSDLNDVEVVKILKNHDYHKDLFIIDINGIFFCEYMNSNREKLFFWREDLDSKMR